MSLSVLASVIAALGATLQTAPAKQPEIVVTGEKRDPGEKLCEKVMVLGTRLVAKRVCATRVEWDAQRQRDRDTIDDITRRSLQAAPGG